jgi:hypothetical protein
LIWTLTAQRPQVAGGKEIEEKPRPKKAPTKVIDLVSVLQKSLEQAGTAKKKPKRTADIRHDTKRPRKRNDETPAFARLRRGRRMTNNIRMHKDEKRSKVSLSSFLRPSSFP